MLADLNRSGAHTAMLSPVVKSGRNWVPSDPWTGSRWGGRQLLMVVWFLHTSVFQMALMLFTPVSMMSCLLGWRELAVVLGIS